MTRRELIDYCNGRNGSCNDECLYHTRECNAFWVKYKDTPYLSDKNRPELYSDDAIGVEPNMTLEEAIKHAEHHTCNTQRVGERAGRGN